MICNTARPSIRNLATVAIGVTLLAGCQSKTQPALPKLAMDSTRVAVAGFSSGAIMAQQTHLAYSDRLLGAALVSGPPYQCAEGSLDVALSRCMKGGLQATDIARLAQRIEERASRNELASLEGLAGDRVLAMHGRKDMLVPEAVARASLAMYEALPVASEMSLRWDGDGEFAHVWPTQEAGGDCSTTATPYLGRCGRDVAGEVMQALFDLPPSSPGSAQGELLQFDQSRFNPEGADAFLDDTGYLYRPPQCKDENACGLLIAFHGCEQNAASVGEAFVRDAGFNRWADVYGVVVLYPQTRATYMPLNPKACWDWWGYSGADYDTRKGVQQRWLANAAAALGVALK